MLLQRYDMDIIPEATARRRHWVVQLLLQSGEMAPYRGSLATDFRSILISKSKLQHGQDVIEIQYRSEREDEPATGAIVYKVHVRFTKSLSIGELVNWMNSTSLGQAFPDKEELIQALNIFLNHYTKSSNNIATIGSTKSFSLSEGAAKGDLGAGLEAIRSFFSSVRLATCRTMVNINVSHSAFYHTGPLPSLIISYGPRSTVALERFLKLVRVQTTYPKEKRNKVSQVIPRTKTTFGLATNDDGHGMVHPPRVRQHGAGAKDVEFWLEGETSSAGPLRVEVADRTNTKGKGKGKAQPKSSVSSGSGKYISVFDFFNATYNRVLRNPELSVVNCGNRENPMYLPPEVCVVVSGQPSKAKLDSGQTQQMIRHAVRKPWDNAPSIVEQGIQVAGLDGNSNTLLRTFDLKITPGLIKVPGRILNSPKVIYKGNKSADPRFEDPALSPFLQRAAKALSLLFIILPEVSSSLYKRIKTLADKSYGIHTICSVGSKLAKDRGRDQYIANVALKCNLKLGGIN
ncbi:hypothetical protein SLS59_008557 [Nothophoma quercina]|uniref:PAZ domain-containing protein n=1 Tax=Nothophoma quercina TaxID=749835 RepID=A0ABR3QS78_9PLEO